MMVMVMMVVMVMVMMVVFFIDCLFFTCQQKGEQIVFSICLHKSKKGGWKSYIYLLNCLLNIICFSLFSFPCKTKGENNFLFYLKVKRSKQINEARSIIIVTIFLGFIKLNNISFHFFHIKTKKGKTNYTQCV
jgi:hypothetical protein